MAQKTRRMEKFEDNEEGEEEKKPTSTDIAGPLFAWIFLLFVALVIKFIISGSVLPSGSSTGIGSWLSTIANFILGTPGEIILPLAIGAAIGAEVGEKADALRNAQKSGLLNGVYAAVIYSLVIIVIYEIVAALIPTAAPNYVVLLGAWIAMPSLICIIVTEVFAVLSFSRKVNG